MEYNILELIKYLVWIATERGTKLTTIRLVKFLYLTDLYWARENNGKTFTGWPWKFVHYGPFCGESLETINEAHREGLIEKAAYDSKYVDDEYYLYWCKEEPKTAKEFPLYLLSPLKQAVSKWGDDTYGLLDHVYFDTEPMIDAKKGDLLDFSKARKFEKPKEIKMLKLTQEQVTKSKEIIERLKTKYKEGLASRDKGPQPVYDEVYHKAARFLDEEDLEGELSGKAEILVT